MRDIHLAEAVNWWPLAWGWWLVIVVSIAALILLFYALYRRHRKKATQRYALAELSILRQKASQQDPNYDWPKEASILLRRYVAQRYPLARGLSGQAWLDFLQQHQKNNTLSPEVVHNLLLAPYRKQDHSHADETLNWMQQWIKEQRHD